MKNLEDITKNEELNVISNRLPDNIKICEDMLILIGNMDVKVVQSQDIKSKNSFYNVISNTITISNMGKSYARIQVLAHECIHSVQDKKILKLNFIYANLYIIYLIIIFLLTMSGKIENYMFHMIIIAILGIVQYHVKTMLEIDAISKSKYLARDYLENIGMIDKNDIYKIVLAYEKINNIGLKAVNFYLLTNVLIKPALYCVLVVLMKLYIKI